MTSSKLIAKLKDAVCMCDHAADDEKSINIFTINELEEISYLVQELIEVAKRLERQLDDAIEEISE